MYDVQFDSFSNPLVAATAFQPAKRLQKWRIQENAKAIMQHTADHGAMFGVDAVGSEAAIALARELEFIHNQVLEDVYEDLNALSLIPVDASVPAGAKYHTVRRERKGGKMVFYKGNSRDLGQTTYEREEKQYRLWPAVTKVDLNFFDQMKMDFAGIALESKLREAAQRVADEFINEKTWFGDSDHGVPGMLNADFCLKGAAGVTFGPGGASASSQLAELHRLANQAAQATKGKFGPTAMAAPREYIDYWSNTHLDTANSSNQSILQAFLDKNRYVNRVEVVDEFSGAGTTLGVSEADVVLFFRPGDKNAAHRVMPQGLTFLPMQRDGFDMYIPAYLIFGGVNQYDPLNNFVVYADYAES